MLSPNDIKPYKIFSELDTQSLEKIIELAQPAEFESESVIFNEGEPAENIYILTSGKILLEQKMTKHITVTVDTLKPGEILGTSGLMGYENYTLDAVAAEKSEVLVMNTYAFKDLLSQNPEIGFNVLKNICITMKKQLVERTDLFVRAVSTHPDFSELEE